MVIPVLSDVLTQPGIMVGMGLGLCVGFILRGYLQSESSEGENGINDSEDNDWDEDGFLADGGQMKLVLVVRSDLKMGKGKMAAQCCHATLKAYKQLAARNRKMLKKWEMSGQPKVVVKVDGEGALLDLAQISHSEGLITSIIQDAGRTQIAAGSRTVLGVGPGPVEVVDSVTGHLKLL